VRGVYDRLERPFDTDAVAGWASANPQHRHGAHRYDLAQFGLTGDDFDTAFAPYLDRYGIVAGAWAPRRTNRRSLPVGARAARRRRPTTAAL